MIVLAILFILFITGIIIFAFPQFSPIPYFPSNSKDLPLIIRSLQLKKDQVVFDLGAGDGVIIFTAARKALHQKINTRFIAVEMNPILAFILHIRRLLHPNKKHIMIVWGDMFKIDYQKLAGNRKFVTVYIYVSPRFIPKIVKTFQSHHKHFYLVSYFYPIDTKTKPKATGVHDVYTKSF